MKSSILILSALLLIVIIFGITYYQPFYNGPLPQNQNVKNEEVPDVAVKSRPIKISKFNLPSGKETFQIAQAAEALPKIIQATVDPPDVRVGDKQKLSIILETDADIVSVEAQIQTDNGIKTVPLKLEGVASANDIITPKVSVNAKNELVLGEPELNRAGVSVASAAETKTLTYSGEWIVEDTHDAKYHTKFIAKDSLGHENSITIAWSDACSIPTGGDWNLATTFGSDCVISSDDGVDNGNVTIQTYTLTLNAKFAFNPGRAMTITSGAVAIGSGGEIQKNYIYRPDVDTDGYPDTPTYYYQSTPPAGGRRQYVLVSNTPDCDSTTNTKYAYNITWRDNDNDTYNGSTSQTCGTGLVIGTDEGDCNDANSSVYRDVTSLIKDDDHDKYSTDTSDTRCVGALISSYWYRTSGGVDYIKNTNDLGTDCDDTNAAVFQNKSNLARDNDLDSTMITAQGNVSTKCVGAGSYFVSSRGGGGTHYNDGTYWWDDVSNSGPWAYNDCDDANLNAYPGQTNYFTTARSNGTYDYNCNGSSDKQYPSLAQACNATTCSGGTQGWSTSIPSCGGSGSYVSKGCSWTGAAPQVCTLATQNLGTYTQGCR